MVLPDERYQRHGSSLPNARRKTTAVIALGGHDAPRASAFATAALAAAGIGAIGSTCPGRHHPGVHFMDDSLDRLVAAVNPEVEFEPLLIDPEVIFEQVSRLTGRFENTWVLVHANYPRFSVEELAPLAAMGLRLPVVLAWNGPGGVYVHRLPNPAAAMEFLAPFDSGDLVLPNDHEEIALLAAGLAVNEILLGGSGTGDDLSADRIVGFYSLCPARRRRVMIGAAESAPALVEEIGRKYGGAEARDFSGKRIRQVGAGALGNWTAPAIAADRDVAMTYVDGDVAEPNNLNRQLFLVDHLGRPKAPALAAEMGRLFPGRFEGRTEYVRSAGDLEPFEDDILICVPDNLYARALCADFAWRRGVLYGQAGTSAQGGQILIQEPGRACAACMTGVSLDNVRPPEETDDSASCAQAEDSVVSSNMVTAALLVSELRQAVAGRGAVNLRFHGTGAGTNRITWEITSPDCPHPPQPACTTL